ncbi:hypothetical protein C8Q76DRAFT_697896 [Earliella scabrosa]|nr:hypothetical protein C8Q76DRAFT_697896 [Earliella scabrosa]
MADTHDIPIPVAVTIIRPAHPGVRPPLFKAIEPPPTALTLGSKVHLEIPFYRKGQLWLVAPTGAKGTVISVASLYHDAVEVIIRKDTPSGVYVYLIVPLEEKYIALPPRLSSGYLLIEPYLLTFSLAEAGGDPNNETTSKEYAEYLPMVGFSGHVSNSVLSPTTIGDEEKDDDYDGLDLHERGIYHMPDRSTKLHRMWCQCMWSWLPSLRLYKGMRRMHTCQANLAPSRLAFHACPGKLRFWTENRGRLSRTPHVHRCYSRGPASPNSPPLSRMASADLTPLKLRVAVRRPASSICGGLYEVIERLSQPLRLGMRVSLNLNYVSSNRHGIFVHPWITVSTGIKGLIMGIEGMRTDALIFLVCDESFGNAYEYLLVTTIFPGYIELPQAVWMGYALVKCTLLSTAVGLSRGDGHGGFPWTVGLSRGSACGGSPWRPGVSDFVSWTPGSDGSSMQTSSNVRVNTEDHEADRSGSRSPKAQDSVDWIRASSFRRARQDRASFDWIGLDVIMEEGSSSGSRSY